MDIKISKEKTPEIKFKKEAEISIHKKKLITAKEEDQTFFHKKDSSDFFGNIRMRNHSSDDDRPVTESGKEAAGREYRKQQRTRKWLQRLPGVKRAENSVARDQGRM